MSITVAVVEDNKDFRAGIAFVLKSAMNLRCVGEFSNAEQLLHEFPQILPEIILMDIGLPGISGIEATAQLKAKHPASEVIILSVFEDDENIFHAICAGASGYVTKPVMPQQLLEAVEQASNGGTPMSPHIARKVLKMFKKYAPPPQTDYSLTKRELEILELLVDGNDFKEIAGQLFVSLFTVRAHIRNIYDKLHVHSKSQAVVKALRENLI